MSKLSKYTAGTALALGALVLGGCYYGPAPAYGYGYEPAYYYPAPTYGYGYAPYGGVTVGIGGGWHGGWHR